MIGVVLWSDPAEKKAVLWCEDHGDLAYFDASSDELEGSAAILPGDMVEFDVSVHNRVRHAYNAMVIETRVCNGLQENLRKTAFAGTAPPRPQAANVVDMIPAGALRRPA